jgi:hypothetical protein
MVGLPWVRLDSNIASHDKILALLAEPGGVKAAWMYVCTLGHCGGHGTDGLLSFESLPFVHGTKHLAKLLVDHDLITPDPQGWRIPNWGDRQQSVLATETRRAAQSAGARKANCIRWHGPACGCWEDDTMRSHQTRLPDQ